ncbi:MAG: tRNA uridine-5-carboxymethylaminomethyl(34) synthesis enzyme MnmG [Alphaproteobacteria bacterium]|nr:tRNA uridine-5-carboxymethylaminomethyl(34) synthesis enzyme MnmG [Alphaproteobacteria bacterium]
MDRFDVVVVGAGHAGAEAAAIAARLGRRVACVTFRREHVGRLSCNPAVGGLAKGHLVREIDALGGGMARVADATCIQFRRLNTRKGLAVQSSRAQVDIDLYPERMRATLEALPGLTLIEGEVTEIRTRSGRVSGVVLADGTALEAEAVVLTTGTFLGGVLHRGEEREDGGRVGDRAAHRLSDALRDLGLRRMRLKTGTVPRVDGRTIDWSRVPAQEDTVPDGRFSFGPPGPRLPQITCHATWTNPAVHDEIRASLHLSPLFTGAIVGRGPRYCPSIEDKVTRFADRDRHLLFLEPEGLSTDRVYVAGLSTSLPPAVQERMVRGIVGLERATILQHGYAVEYDAIDPTALDHGLGVRGLPGLFLAGQVNGTSGYEEAAAQGLVAGFSAALGETFHVERSDAYVGVLVDDLVSRGVDGEPYRMFTSRAEHRLLLREDNADRRLMPRARALGVIDDATWARFEAKLEAMERGRSALDAVRLLPGEVSDEALEAAGVGPVSRMVTGADLLRRPDATWAGLRGLVALPELSAEAAEQVEIDLKYEGYVRRAERRADEARRMEGVALPPDLDFDGLAGLSTEVRERLRARRPATLGQAARVPGVTAAAVGVLAAELARRARI